jgi:S-adenosylmethionine decarboxylase
MLLRTRALALTNRAFRVYPPHRFYGGRAMPKDRPFAELAVVAGYGDSTESASAVQPSERFQPQIVDNDDTLQELEQRDFFVQKDGLTFAGTHLLIDLDQAENLDDIDSIEAALKEAALAGGATILNVDLHRFELNGGVSGVVVLAESHITIHTWPENGFAALDVFMCGECDPYKAIPVLKRVFKPGSVQVTENRRGLRV